MNIVHRDIKPENLLLDDEGFIKLCDFGSSKFLQTKSQLLDEYIGTSPYMAPEIHSHKKYKGQSADIWSLGCLLYIMVVG
jgi:protein-serine/threonine kinase